MNFEKVLLSQIALEVAKTNYEQLQDNLYPNFFENSCVVSHIYTPTFIALE